MLRPTTLSIVLLLAWTVALCALQANNRRLSSYKSRAKLLLAFSSVLNLDRNVWIACWRSSPVAAFCRRPRSFGSVQQTPVAGTPIRRCTDLLCCYVRSWYVGSRYANSSVYQSVVLNVGIWYGDSPVAGRRSPVAGTPLRQCTNLLCWTLESDTATRRSPVAGRRYTKFVRT